MTASRRVIVEYIDRAHCHTKWFLNYLPSWPTSNVTEIGSAAMTFRADTRGPDSTPATAARFEASPRPGSCNQMWCTRHERGSCGRRPCSACKSSAHAALWPLTSANHRGSDSFTRMLLTAELQTHEADSGDSLERPTSSGFNASLFIIAAGWRRGLLSASTANVQ